MNRINVKVKSMRSMRPFSVQNYWRVLELVKEEFGPRGMPDSLWVAQPLERG